MYIICTYIHKRFLILMMFALILTMIALILMMLALILMAARPDSHVARDFLTSLRPSCNNASTLSGSLGMAAGDSARPIRAQRGQVQNKGPRNSKYK